MRLALALCLVLVVIPAYPSEPDDRKAIAQTIKALNKRLSGGPDASVTSFVAVETSAADFKFLQQLRGSERTWSEVTAIHFEIKAVRIDRAGTATLDVDLVQFGSLMLVRRIPITLTMKRAAPNWLITSIKPAYPATAH